MNEWILIDTMTLDDNIVKEKWKKQNQKNILDNICQSRHEKVLGYFSALQKFQVFSHCK